MTESLRLHLRSSVTAIAAAAALCAGCASGPDGGTMSGGSDPGGVAVLDAAGGLPEVPGAEVYGLDPEAFLAALTKTGGYWITLDEDAPAGWLTEAHVPALEARLQSTAPCPHVLSGRAVNLPMDGASTERNIARYMIAAARAGRFPIDLGSVDDSY